jgi:hypothetical protein
MTEHPSIFGRTLAKEMDCRVNPATTLVTLEQLF